MFLNQRVSSGFFAVLILGAVVGLPARAQTPPVLMLSDSIGDSLTIDSSGMETFACPHSCSISSFTLGSGTITVSGSIGPFTFTDLTGESKPALTPPQIDVHEDPQSGFLGTAGTGMETLTIEWSDTLFTGGGVGSSATMSETTNCTSHAATNNCFFPQPPPSPPSASPTSLM